ncbi:cell division protein SepF [Alkalibacillus almallahensis]|uniref:cell division protein SepF n=1 Tax=Alkalibacillus almallahensis TaxID=1379154 RepID=UPI001422DF3D|nr:cell division protein SepF [Alkalibacillus almallahensis]NIK10710.1 cell division inhibitor SepF [Alkalibacillus almallahensis]
MSFKDKFKSFFDLDEQPSFEEESKSYRKQPATHQQEAEQPVKPQTHDNVVSLTSIQNDAKMVLFEPTDFDDVQEIAEHVKKKKSVVINLQRVEHPTGLRIVDFLSGTVNALNGDIQKLGQKTFLCTPENVNISGSISEIFNDDEQ